MTVEFNQAVQGGYNAAINSITNTSTQLMDKINEVASPIIASLSEMGSCVAKSITYTVEVSLEKLSNLISTINKFITGLFFQTQDQATQTVKLEEAQPAETTTAEEIKTDMLGTFETFSETINAFLKKNGPTEETKAEIRAYVQTLLTSLQDSVKSGVAHVSKKASDALPTKEEVQAELQGMATKAKEALATTLNKIQEFIVSKLPTEEEKAAMLENVKAECNVILERVATNAQAHEEPSLSALDPENRENVTKALGHVDSGNMY